MPNTSEASENKRNHRRYRIITALSLAVIIIAVSSVIFVNIYKSRFESLDTSEYRALTNAIQETADSGEFENQKALRNYIRSWADENELEYKVDSADNIIFSQDGASRKKNTAPTVVCLSYNFETARDNAGLLASAAMIAKTELDSGPRRVIFFNDVRNEGRGYREISSKYLTSKSKIIYLDYGSASYLSRSSFAMDTSTIYVPAKKTKSTCDTAVRIHIGGIPTGEVGTGISHQPDPVSAFSTLLTRLKSRSTICQLADVQVGTNGNMYPVSIDATILLNSYSVSSFTKYIDKRIRSWEKSYGEIDGIEYTYEVIDNQDDLPGKAYTQETTSTLTNVLYTIQTGTYKYADDDNIPEGREAGDICGINSILGLRSDSDYIKIDLISQGHDQDHLDRVNGDNEAAAKLFKCKIRNTSSVQAFSNEKDSLSRVLMQTYIKVNDIAGAESVMRQEIDNYFTPCSYLSELSNGADIVHLRLNPGKTVALTNTIMCYIETKGNFFSI